MVAAAVVVVVGVEHGEKLQVCSFMAVATSHCPG